jgi:hypothetical protein
MSYGYGIEANKVCHENTEDRIARVSKDYKIEKKLEKQLDKFIARNGIHVLRELNMERFYTQVVANRKRNKHHMNQLIREQEFAAKKKK